VTHEHGSNVDSETYIFDHELKLSELTYTYPNYEGKDRNLVVSNTSGASALVEDDILEMLLKFKEPRTPSEFADQAQEQIISDFYKAEILIDANRSGFDILGEKIDRMKNRPELDIIPVVTVQCNLACPYCFEGSPGKETYMSEKLVEKIVDYSVERIENEGITKLFSSLYGGEPLLNKKTCYLFLEKMDKEADRLNVPHRSDLITNGTLIDKEFLEFVSQLDGFFVQVTIDGPREVHNQRRIFKNGKGSYDIIMGNLATIADYAELRLRVNVDTTNLERIPDLIEDLVSTGVHQKNVYVSLARVTASTSQNMEYKPKCISAKQFDMSILPYVKKLREAGFEVFINPTKKPRYIYCAAYSGKHIAIDPDGNLFTCLEGMGNPDYVVGNIWEDPMYNSRYDEWKSVSVLNFAECRKCDTIGFCGGGCGAEALAKYGCFTKGLACPPVKWSYVGGVVLPAEFRRELEEVMG